MKIEITTTDDTGNVNTYNVSGCFIWNNSERPKKAGHYFVMYSDKTDGAEYFDGNNWKVEYDYPVTYWLLS